MASWSLDAGGRSASRAAAVPHEHGPKTGPPRGRCGVARHRTRDPPNMPEANRRCSPTRPAQGRSRCEMGTDAASR